MALGTALPARIGVCPEVDTYFIDPAGDDSTGDGSVGNPWETPAKAFAEAAPGSMILAETGTYTLSGQQEWDQAGSNSLVTQMKAAPGASPLFTGTFRFLFTGSYFRLGPGLALTGPGAPDLVKITSGGTRIEVVGNELTMTAISDFSEGILATEGDGPGQPIVQIWDNKHIGNGTFVTNKNHCIYLSDVGPGCVVANGVFTDLEAGYGTQMNPGPGVIVTCCSYYLNTNRGGVVLEETGYARVVGCIITDMQTGVQPLTPAAGNAVSDCIGDNDGTDFGSASGVTYTNCLSNTDPLYDDPASGDLHISNNASPAKALVPAAREGYVPALDHDGNARQTADAGAYAVGEGEPPPPPDQPPQNITVPVITGSPVDGENIDTTDGTWANGTTSFAYQWQRCNSSGGSCVDIGGATGDDYTLTSADIGSRIRVRVTATNDEGSTAAFSEPTAVVGGVSGGSGAPVNTVAPTISGVYQQGRVLTAGPGTWTGDTPMTFAYQWVRCNSDGSGCVDIGGATGQTRLVSSTDVGKKLRVDVVATN